MSHFEKNVRIQKITFWFLLLRETDIICNFFGCKHFVQNLTCRKKFNSQPNALCFFQSKIWRNVKLLNQNLTPSENFVSKSDALEDFVENLTSFKTFFPKSDFFFVFQVLTESWYLLSTFKPTKRKGENWKTMFVIDLVARCTTESSHTSVGLSVCEE